MAPFKAQNMSNNSMVCADGAEIGRAQWLQAVAAGAEPEAAMNPVLLKPGSDRRSHVVLLGRPHGEAGRGRVRHRPRGTCAEAASAALADLRGRYDVVVCEGAGSPTEINLRAGDYVNMGLARRAGLPVVVVGDIDRGGVFAAMYGTLALLSADDQALRRRLDGQQVPRRPGPAASPASTDAAPAHRPARCSACCPGCPTCGWTPRTRSADRRLAAAAGRRRRRRRRCGSRSSGCRGCPTPPTWTRWPPSRASA